MTSQTLGEPTSIVEVLNISPHGIWLFVSGTEYFMPYDDFPWFKDATVGQIHNVQLVHRDHLHWPDLDVDLGLSSLQQPDAYPLIAGNP